MSPDFGVPDCPARGTSETSAAKAPAAKIELILRRVIVSHSPWLSQSTPGGCRSQSLIRPRRLLVHPCVYPAHAAQVGARAGDLRKIFLVRGEIHAPRGFFGGCTMRAEVGDLFRDV